MGVRRCGVKRESHWLNIIKNMNVQNVAEKISNFLRKEFRKRNKTKAILGLSGGVDSTTVAFLSKGINTF